MNLCTRERHCWHRDDLFPNLFWIWLRWRWRGKEPGIGEEWHWPPTPPSCLLALVCGDIGDEWWYKFLFRCGDGVLATVSGVEGATIGWTLSPINTTFLGVSIVYRKSCHNRAIYFCSTELATFAPSRTYCEWYSLTISEDPEFHAIVYFGNIQ